eukprot:TRINITY_DN23168_c0_g1_i1.p1 TRINITY_DN23168_c0_g1~~TRINITY_DN23168_c0_g1_i1.p1  ORF type:complete len:316 (+),score=55.58 TRINITY_DN23168_c0_g1_i1:66-1013(+)
MGNTAACSVCCTEVGKRTAPHIRNILGEDFPGVGYIPPPRPAGQNGAVDVAELVSITPRSKYDELNHQSGVRGASASKVPAMSGVDHASVVDARCEGDESRTSAQESTPGFPLAAAPATAKYDSQVATAVAPELGLAAASKTMPANASLVDSERHSCVGSDIISGAGASDSTATSVPEAPGQAQAVVKNFVKTYIKGQEISVLSMTGSLASCLVSLDRKLTVLSLQRAGKKDAKKRGVPLEDIGEVCVGKEGADDVDLPLDELCVTLLLADGQAIGFRFADVEERDTFALCISMFVDGRRAELSRKKKSRKGGDN